MIRQTKMLMDCENRKSLPGFDARDENGQSIELIWAGKCYNITQPDASDKEIYQLLETHCGLIFLLDDTPKDLCVYPVPMLVIFATDRDGNYFGFIGGFGDMLDEEISIGFVNSDGRFGKVAKSMKAFLELNLFYPRWRECLRDGLTDEVLEELCQEISNEEQLLEPAMSLQVIDTLGLEKHSESLNQLLLNIRGEVGFALYASMEELKKDYKFLEVKWDVQQGFVKLD